MNEFFFRLIVAVNFVISGMIIEGHRPWVALITIPVGVYLLFRIGAHKEPPR